MTSVPGDKGLNVIALISGGKDSLYSILHCIRNGHRVVALANLHPPIIHHDHDSNVQEEDMDSFMYQTIGHNVIPLYEPALGIPLYREPITGGAMDTSRIYRDSSRNASSPNDGRKEEEEDETESLIPLLNRIKRDIPHANAVSAGAILSTYQRTRIENVAGRLGLVPLAFLWMYPYLPPSEESVRFGNSSSGGLLNDMAAAGCDSRIIKVASGGLDADILWENVASSDGSIQRRIEKAMKRFVDAEDLKGAVLGEGGEYETLALDGPGFLWKQRIVVEEADRQVQTAGSGVNFVRILNARCVPKEDYNDDKQHEDSGRKAVLPRDIRRPCQLDERFRRALDQVPELQEQGQQPGCASSVVQNINDTVAIDTHETNIGGLYTISNIIAPEAGPTADAQMRGISEKLKPLLHNRRNTSDVVFATVLLRSMQDFGPMNAIYVSLFTRPNPPARVTVACGERLPDGVQVMISVVVDLGERNLRQGLHVQSRSYWAPANIGPYSQAITVPYNTNHQGKSTIKPGDAGGNSDGGIIYIAGQIPLDPPSMEIPGGIDQGKETWVQNYSLHATLSLQHLWRIGLATQVDWWVGAIVFLARDAERGHQKAQIAHRLWQALHARDEDREDDEDDAALDVWDIKHGLREDPRLATAQGGRPLPNFDILVDNTHSNTVLPPWFAVEIEELPRNSDIEWQALGTTGMTVSAPVLVPSPDRDVKIWCTKLNDGNRLFYTMEMAAGTGSLVDRINTAMSAIIKPDSQHGAAHCTIYTSCRLSMTHWKGQIIPCHTVWGSNGDTIAAAITVQV